MHRLIAPLQTLALPVLLALLVSAVTIAHADDRPNFLLIVADDSTWSDYGFAGNPDVKTPNLDRLRAEGMFLDHMFSPASTCSPSRNALYTGLFPIRSGAFPNHTRVFDGVSSIFTHLKKLGYRVALQNKSHVGPRSSYPYEAIAGADRLVETEAFLRRDDEQPWLLVYASNDPHSRWTRGPRYDAKKLTVPPYLHDNETTRELLAAYYGEISKLDEQTGNLLRLLETTEQAQDTLVMFVSEQGSSLPYGGKWSLHDNGIRVSTLVRWPGHVAPGSTSHALVQYVDVPPTLLEAAGVDPAQIDTGSKDAHGHRGFDGRSFLSVLRGERETFRELVFSQQTTVGIHGYQAPYPMRAVRDARYKLIRNLCPENRYWIRGIHEVEPFLSWTRDAADDPALARRFAWLSQRPAEELYDLSVDPLETRNLAADASLEPVKMRLARALSDWMAQQGDRGLETELLAPTRQGPGRQNPERQAPKGQRSGRANASGSSERIDPDADATAPEESARPKAPERPNIVLVLIDDMGFSDLGCYGGEIATPTIDRLAAGGVRFSQFYNNARCCPTRATLMTGLHPHQTGIGHMTNPPNQTNHDLGVPSYRGFLNDRCVTIAESLRDAGYATLMTGKWHLGFNERECWPLQRGFERYFGSIPGATRYFHPEQPRGMVEGNEPIEHVESTTDRAFYTTDAFTDHAIRFIEDERSGRKRPFFLYLAYTAPHWPLQAHEEDIARYRGRYRVGWDRLRESRYRRQIELGLIDPRWKLSPRDPRVPPWDSLDPEQQDLMDLKMAIYAAMIDRLDQNLGKLVASLERSGAFEDTLFLVLADNGGCAEGGVFGRGEFRDVEKRNLEHSNAYGVAWANVSSTPFRLYKHFAHEGGAATPLIAHWPAVVRPQERWIDEPAHLIDIVPTLLDVAGAEHPRERHGKPIPALDGLSLRPLLEGKPLGRERTLSIEHENNAFVRSGDWKLVGRGVATASGLAPQKWELYNLREDRTELVDLSDEHPGKRAELAAIWSAWAEKASVYPKRRTNDREHDEKREEGRRRDAPSRREE